VLGLLAFAVLAGWGADAARADSAVGVDTALGNAFNPPGRSVLPRALVVEGTDSVRRSPSGQLYGVPYDLSDAPLKGDGGWEYKGSVDVGVLTDDASRRNALFRKYKDPRSGLYLDHFDFEADKPDSAHYLQILGGGAGSDDQFYGLQFGRHNDWKVKLFYNETTHVFTDTYKPLYNGAGTGTLTLAGGLRPFGGATPVISGAPTVGSGVCSSAAPCWAYTGADGVPRTYSSATALVGINWTGGAVVAAGTPISTNSIAGGINRYLDTIPGDTESGLVRRKGGAAAEVRFGERWRAYASYGQEHRSGTRPFSMNENNYTVEVPEPIDYTSHDFLTGVSYADPQTQANLRLAASLFRNHVSTLSVQQPWLAAATGVAAAQTTIFDLYPDNNALGISGEFARDLPDFFKGRLTVSAEWGTSRQDDALLLPLDPAQSAQIQAAIGSPILAGINNPGYALNRLDLRNWDGTNGFPLSQRTALQRIDTRLLTVNLSLRPWDPLSLKADARHFETDNKGGYLAYNPLTGQFGRGFRNSTAFDLVVGSSGLPGAIGQPCYVPGSLAPVAGCVFNGNAGVAGQSTNNPANVPVLSPPRDVRQTQASIAADYDIGAARSLNGAIEREIIRRAYRERDRTWDDKVKIGYVDRGFEEATVRVTYESARRRGTDYRFWPVDDFGTGLPGLDWNTIVTQYLKSAAAAPGWTVSPANLSGYLARYAYESRKFDQADRDQQVLNGRLNYIPREDLDLGLWLQHKDLSYPDSGYGLHKERTTSITVDTSYQPSANHQLYAYYSWQAGSSSVRANAGTNPAGANNTCAPTVADPWTPDTAAAQCAQQIWLAASTWNMDSRDLTGVLGLGLQSAFGPYRLGLDYVQSSSRTRIGYDFGPNVLTAAQALVAGAGYPDMVFTQRTLTARLLIPIQKATSVHLLFRHESGRVKDWHYDGMPIGASAAENNATLMLDAGPQNYHANVFGLLLQFRL
jgi:hypothetical protein